MTWHDMGTEPHIFHKINWAPSQVNPLLKSPDAGVRLMTVRAITGCPVELE